MYVTTDHEHKEALGPHDWPSLQRDERVYVLRHLTSWTSARDCVRDVLRQVVQRVEDDEHAALAAALLEWEWWTVEYPLT